MRAATNILVLALGFACNCLAYAGRELTDRELEDLVHKIEALETDESEIHEGTVHRLIGIVSSDNLSHHRPFVVASGHGGTSYHPLSTYAIWALSSILEDAPYTYADRDWDMGAHMTGERKRWMEWWEKNKESYSLRPPGSRESPASPDVEAEKRRQAENRAKYLEISRLEAAAQADGEFLDYFELEKRVLFGGSKSVPDTPSGVAGGDLIPKRAKEKQETQFDNNRSSESKYQFAPRPSRWPFVLAGIAVLGSVVVLIRVFLRRRA